MNKIIRKIKCFIHLHEWKYGFHKTLRTCRHCGYCETRIRGVGWKKYT